jgi:hypothetical protein
MSTAAIEVELAGANAGGHADDQGEPIALSHSAPLAASAIQTSNHPALPLLEQLLPHENVRGADSLPQSTSSSDAPPNPSSSRRKSTAATLNAAATANRRTSVTGAADLTAFQRDMLTDSPGLGWLTALCCCRENGVHPRLFDLGTI